MSLKTWQGLLERIGGEVIEVKISYDDLDAQITVEEIKTIAATGKKTSYGRINPLELNQFSLIRAMMGLVK